MPIFISSTFRDMDAERDVLTANVFPELGERLAALRRSIVPIDLRWGVATETKSSAEEKELLVLQVCLSEIDRSRPFFIALLGDRYGWVPPFDRVEQAAQEVGYGGALAGRSVTAIEVEYGVLDRPEMAERCWFYFREPLPYDHMSADAAARYTDRGNDPEATERAEMLADLKDRIRLRFPSRVRSYQAEWDVRRQRVTGLDDFSALVTADLWDDLSSAFEGAPPPPRNWRTDVDRAQEAFEAEHLLCYVPRTLEESELVDRLSEPTRKGRLHVVLGPSGTGESSLAVGVARTLRDKGDERIVLFHSAAASTESASAERAIRRVGDDLAKVLGVEERAPTAEPGDDDPFLRFQDLLASSPKQVTLVFDALDQIEITPRTAKVDWLPRHDNLTVLATAVDTSDAGMTVAVSHDATVTTLGPMDPATTRELVQRIGLRYRRSVPPRVLDQLARCDRAPLWIWMAAEDLLQLDEQDYQRLSEFEGSAEEQLLLLLEERVRGYPDDIEGLYEAIFRRAEDDYGRHNVAATLASLTVTVGGLREADIGALHVVLTGESWEQLTFARVRRRLRAHIAMRGIDGGFELTHSQTIAAARVRYLDGRREPTLRYALASHLLELDPDDPVRLADLTDQLIWCGDRRGLIWYLGGLDLEGVEAGIAANRVATFIAANPKPNLEWLLNGLAELLPTTATRWYEIGEPLAQLRAWKYLVLLALKVDDRLAGRAPLGMRLDLLEYLLQRLDHFLASTRPKGKLLMQALVVHKLARLQYDSGDQSKAIAMTAGWMNHVEQFIHDGATAPMLAAVYAQAVDDWLVLAPGVEGAEAAAQRVEAVLEASISAGGARARLRTRHLFERPGLGDVAAIVGMTHRAEADEHVKVAQNALTRSRAVHSLLFGARLPDNGVINDDDSNATLWAAYARGVRLSREGDLAGAINVWSSCERLLSRRFDERAERSDDRALLQLVRSQLGIAYRDAGRPDEAKGPLASAERSMATEVRRAPDDQRARERLCDVRCDLARLCDALDEPSSEAEWYQAAIEALGSLDLDDPDMPLGLIESGRIAHSGRASCALRRGDIEEAELHGASAVRLAREAVKRGRALDALSNELDVLGRTHERAGNPGQAWRCYTEAAEIDEAALARSTNEPLLLGRSAFSHERLGRLLKSMGDRERARTELRTAARQLVEAFDIDPDSPRFDRLHELVADLYELEAGDAGLTTATATVQVLERELGAGAAASVTRTIRRMAVLLDQVDPERSRNVVSRLVQLERRARGEA